MVRNNLHVITNRQSLPPYWTRGVGGHQYGAQAEDSETAKAQNGTSAPGLGAIEKCGVEFARAASSQESSGHAIEEFIGWYCSEPRLAFNRSVVLRWRFFLELKNLAPATINVRLAAVRGLAYEASDAGLLSPDLAAGIRRVKGAKRLGVRIRNWLSVDETKALPRHSSAEDLRSKRDRAILAILVGCGLRRAELVALKMEDFRIREEHCFIADLIGKGKHIRTVPVPVWVKRTLDAWTATAEISSPDGKWCRRLQAEIQSCRQRQSQRGGLLKSN